MNLLTKYPLRSPDTAFRIIENEAVVVSCTEGTARVLNETGARVWELLDGVRGIDEIIEIIIADFKVSKEEARADIVEFLKELIEKKMVVMLDEPQS